MQDRRVITSYSSFESMLRDLSVAVDDLSEQDLRAVEDAVLEVHVHSPLFVSPNAPTVSTNGRNVLLIQESYVPGTPWFVNFTEIAKSTWTGSIDILLSMLSTGVTLGPGLLVWLFKVVDAFILLDDFEVEVVREILLQSGGPERMVPVTDLEPSFRDTLVDLQTVLAKLDGMGVIRANTEDEVCVVR